VLASFLATYALCASARADVAPAVLAAFLALAMTRRVEPFAWDAAMRRFVTLPLVGIAAALVGLALHTVPPLGAALFCAAMFVAVWLRNYGPRAAAIGTTIAMPLVAMLVVPVRVSEGRGPIFDVLLVLAAGAIAVVITSIAALFRGAEAREAAAAVPRVSTLKPSAPSRMALQLLLALIAAFAIGLIFVPAHWPWIVLSAYIVCAGARGRGDALYRGLLRFGGAIAGTLAASLVPHVALPNPIAGAAVIFAVLFAGMALRDRSYAYWAAATTLIFALLQAPQAQTGFELFAARLACIAIGALFGAAAAWFVFPIPTGDMIRLRLAEALRDFGEALVPGEGRAARIARFERAVDALDRAAKPVELHRLVTRGGDEEHPAVWIARGRAAFARGRDLFARDAAAPKHVAGAIGQARRAVGARAGIADALRRVHDAVDAAAGQAPGLAAERREPGDER